MRFSRRQLALVSCASRIVLSAILSLLLAAGPDWPAVSAATPVTPVQVTLTAFTLPSQGQAGNSIIYVTGSPYPAGTIPAAGVTVSFATSCGGTPVASATASAFQLLYGTTRRAQVLIPAALTANTYFVSISGTTSSGTPFVSSNCSQVQVTSGVEPASKLAFSTQPANGTAGSPLGNVVVQVQDANGNVATSSNASITITSTAAGVGGTTTVAAVNGVATFSSLVFAVAGSYTLTGASAGVTSATSTAFTISAGAASKLVFSTQPGNGTAGSPLGNVVVQVQDARGNVVTSSNASITITSTATGVGGTTTVAAVNGVATFSSLVFAVAGSYTLTAASAGVTGATSTAFTISAGAASKLVFSTQPGNGTAGSPLGNVVVQVQDANGNVVTGSNASITITSTAAGVGGTTTVAAVNGVVTFSNLVFTVAGSYTLTAASAGVTSATSTAFTISAGAASKLVFSTQPGNGTAGSPLGNVVVQVQDANGNVVTGSNASITITSTAAGVGGTTTVAAVNGVVTFSNLVFTVAGNYTLTAASTGVTSATSTAFTISAGAASKLVFSTQPGNGTAGSPLGNVVVQVQDANGNVVTGSNASITITSTAAGVGGTTTVAAVNGVVTFSNLVFTVAGHYTLTAASTGVTSATSTAFTISAGAALKLVFSTQPGNGTAGSPLGNVVVQVQDANGNVVTGSNASITITSTAAGVGGTTTVAAVNGVVTFSNLVFTVAGHYTLTAASTGVTSATSTAFTISAGAALKLVFSTQPGNGTAGSPLGNVVVQVQDANGNVVTGSNASITITSTAAGVGGTTTVAAVNGVVTFSNLVFTVAGSYTLTAVSAGVTSATSTPFMISAGSALKLVFSTQPGNGTAGSPLGNVVVQVQDANGNVVTGSNASITIISTAAGVGGTTAVAAVNGVATFSSLVFTVAGSYTLTAASAGMTSATSTPFTITSVPTLLAFTVQPPSAVKALHTFTVQVTVEDNFGNVVTSYGAPMTIRLGNGPIGAALAGTTTQNTVNGVASFSDLSLNTVGNGYTLVVSTGGLNATSNPFKVTVSPELTACSAAGSQSVLVQGSNVNAYVPDGIWSSFGNKNIEVVPLEGTGGRSTILTSNIVNSCASNTVTGETVCTADNTDVYLIQGATLTKTLTSGSNGVTSATAGSCMNCGVVINPLANQAVIALGLSIPGSNATEGIQILDLNTNTFATPVAGNGQSISEGIVVDPIRKMVLAANEANDYELFDVGGSGIVFDQSLGGLYFGQGSGMDSSAEDCSTGIALASVENAEFPAKLFLADLTQATFNPTALPHPTWTAPEQGQGFPEFSAGSPTRLIPGTDGIAVASGAHVGIVTGENGGNAFGVFQLPSTSGSGTPAVLDYVAAIIPNDPSGNIWEVGDDPHPLATYISPNDGKPYGVLENSIASNILRGTDRYLAIVDLQGMLSAPRSGAHTLDANVDLVATGMVRFVRIGPGKPAQLVFTTQPAGAAAGQFFPVQVAAEDAGGNLIVNSTFTITLTLSVAGVVLNSNQVNTLNGVATFSIAIQQAGTYTLSASSSPLPAITSNAFTITPAAAAKLSFVTQPTNIVAGQPLPTIQVAWLDQFGNPTPSNLPITLALNANVSGAKLSGTTTAVPVNGVASFTGLTVDRVGSFSLIASGSGTQVTSGAFEVTSAAAATQLVFVAQPTTAPAGQAMSLIQVAVEDAFGNVVTSANNAVTIALGANPTGATLSALSPGSTSTVASGGYASFFYLTINYAGLGYTLVASSTGLNSATSAPFNISGAGPPVSLTPSSMMPGTTVSVTITAQNTHFQQGSTTATFGPGLMVGSGLSGGYGPVNVTGPTTAIAQVSAAANAKPGLRTVALKTGAEQDTYFDVFAVLGTPFLDSISPSSGQPGQTISVTINGEFTNFVQGITQANFGTGISVAGGTQGGYGPVTVTGPGTAVALITIASGASVGLRTPITVQTGTEQASLPNDGFLVLGPVTGPAPVFNFTSLTEGMEITAPTAVTGTITSPNLSNWTLDYAPAGSNSFTTFATGTTPTVSGTLDPTLLLNGMITVRLTAVDQSGQTTSATTDVVITRKLKVGNFTLSFLDLNIPVAGIPIQVMRTYDSRDKTVGDFGVGWTLSIKSVRIDANGILGNNWIGTTTGGIIPTYCVVAGQNYVVSARLPDGRVFQFQPVPTPDTQCAQVLPPSMVDLMFVPIGSTPPSAQLSQPNATGLIVSGASPGPVKLVDPFTFEAYGFGGDTDQWILTLPNGQKIQASVSFGVQAITDTNGNTLSIGPGGITSSSGPAVTFTRDAQNRIMGIRDPNLNLLQYSYDSNGDLHTVVDQRNNTSQFTYDSLHDLISYTDPTGAQPIRNVYDDSGRLIQQIDAFGHVQDFTHDLVGHTDAFTDFLGNVTTYVYDNHGNIIQQTDALGNITSKTYDANDNVLTDTNALGKTTTYTYDANNNRLSVTDPLGNTTRFTYNTLNQVLTKTDPIGNTTRSTYDSAGNLLTRTDPLGNTTTHTYNSGLLATTKDPLGSTTTYTYLKATPLSMTDPLGNVTSYTYDSNQKRVSQTVVRTTATGQQTLTTRYQYDARNRLVQTTFPDGSVSQTVFNALGQQAATIDELGRQTSYSYDAQHRLVSTTYADGTTETTTYDAVGNKVASTDRSGATTTYTYDPLHRLLATTDPLGAVMSSTYDAAGQRTSRTDARANTMRYGYDDAGRQTTITNPLGELTQLTFDGRGLRISAKDKAGHVTTFQRDAMGRVTQATLADGSIDTITYDARGNVGSRIDAAGKSTLFAHDSLRRLVSVTDALGHTTGYVYDEVGNRTSITDANGHITPFQYDERGRRIRRTLPGGQSETLAYDAAGQVTSHTDFNGKTMTYQYDSAGRLLAKTPDPSFNSPAVRYTYTGLGRRASMTDVSGTTTYGYDLLGRLTSKQSPEGNITYAYDPAGNLISLQAGALTVSYAYDSLDRLAFVTEPSTGTTAYRYDPAGNLQNRTYPNGVVHAYSYDSLNRLTTLAVNKDSSPEASYAQTLGPTGRLLSVSELGGRTVNYTYDADYRLAGESVALAMSGLNGSVDYAYDAVGNRTQTISTLAGVSSVSFGYDVDDRLSEDTYDAAGNTVSSGGLGNFYDFENRLVQRGSVSIAYDGDGNRVSETAGGVTTKYLIDDQNPTGFPQVIAETGSDGGTRTFVYGLERISQLQFIPSSKSSVTSFYIYNGHGSVRALANPAGAITDTYDYDAFGNPINRTGTTVNNYMFAGEPFDPALGIYYNRARYYDERRGRFWTLDTLEGNPGDPQSLHKYLYTRADPVNRLDPSGHEDIEEEVVATEISVELDTMAVAEPFAATVLEANTVVEVSAFGDTIVEAATIVEAEGVPAAVEALGAETAGAAAESLVPQAVQAAAELSTEQLAAITAENQVVYNALLNLVDYPLTAAEEALLEQEIEITLELAIEREIAADTALARLIRHLTSKGFW